VPSTDTDLCLQYTVSGEGGLATWHGRVIGMVKCTQAYTPGIHLVVLLQHWHLAVTSCLICIQPPSIWSILLVAFYCHSNFVTQRKYHCLVAYNAKILNPNIPFVSIKFTGQESYVKTMDG